MFPYHQIRMHLDDSCQLLNGDYEAPKLWINPDIKEFKDFDNSIELKDIKVVDYKHMGPIKFPLAQ